jgi:hypothetical protein
LVPLFSQRLPNNEYHCLGKKGHGLPITSYPFSFPKQCYSVTSDCVASMKDQWKEIRSKNRNVSFPGIRFLSYNVPRAIEEASTLFNLIFGTVVPSVVIFSCNSLIILTVKKAATRRAKLSQKGKEEKDSQNLTAMLLFVSVAYIVTTFPYRVYDPITQMSELSAIYDMTKQYWKLRYSIGLYSVAILWFCNYAVNFYLYCIGGGKRYRNDTKAVIGQLFPCVLKDHLTSQGIKNVTHHT